MKRTTKNHGRHPFPSPPDGKLTDPNPCPRFNAKLCASTVPSAFRHINTHQGKWWKKQLRLLVFPIIYRVLYNIVWDFFYEQWKKGGKTSGTLLREAYGWSSRSEFSRTTNSSSTFLSKLVSRECAWRISATQNTGWWFQPLWKILVKMEIFPK